MLLGPREPVLASLPDADEDVPTAAAAAEALGCTVHQIANSPIFVADGEPLLVIASGAHWVDTKVATDLGYRKVRRARPEFVLEHTGQVVGGVAPFGHPAPVRTVIDAEWAAHERLWAGGGDTAPAGLLDSIFGRPPRSGPVGTVTP
ncbi:YbaK/EbsC family protein [Pseudactinotalea sp. Z1748]|uniref:YbaK/EbsC family protein n=1 Tax=Pseudactinotalea sp. Z1748 TaxID=3413027 RepID=UPI003C7D6625